MPIPGSIIGLMVLFMALILNICPLQWIETGAGFLLKYLPMVFIPATVGVMNYTPIFAGHGVVLLLIVAISTVIVMISAGYTSQFLANKVQNRRDQKLWQSS
ncbi:CidA/LrgA family protein [Aneurinibacillus sp. Ricciae_BoGa-3]|uniref:CidA/LrgA family protein n=1 Tax=Aneurinibacillus sp. Ricciae_BoGa-3 TaxID=3022697 RepID=UPI003FA4AF85